MSPDYPNAGNFYTQDASGKYQQTEPPNGIDLSDVPRMNRADRRKHERLMRRAGRKR